MLDPYFLNTPGGIRGHLVNKTNQYFVLTLEWKLERKKLSNADQTLAMIFDLLSFMSKVGVSLSTELEIKDIHETLNDTEFH